MKKHLIKTLIATSLISSSFGQVIFANTDSGLPHTTKSTSHNNISTTTSTNDANRQSSTLDTTYNKRIKTYTSTDSISKNGMTSTVDSTFIHDKNSSEMMAILNLKGLIPSDIKYNLFTTYTSTNLLWPYKYQVEASTSTPNVKIYENFPKSTIDTSEVNSFVTYTSSSRLDISKEKRPTNGSVAYSKVSSYYQPEYKTVQSVNTNNNVKWDITFDKTRDGYSLDSYNPIYWNQMFMVSRYHTNSEDNLTPKDQLSSLMSEGFSPNMGLVLTSPKGTKKSTIKVSFSRESLLYRLIWGVHWMGQNLNADEYNKDPFINYGNHIDDWNKCQEFIFEIDWQNNTVRSKN